MNSPEYLPRLAGQTVRVFPLYPASNVDGAIRLLFSDASTLRAHHWRICKEPVRRGEARLTSFDHGEKYGLPEPIDAVAQLKQLAEDRPVVASRYDLESGDLVFSFADGAKLQVLNLTGNEDWEIEFPDGTVEYSNYV